MGKGDGILGMNIEKYKQSDGFYMDDEGTYFEDAESAIREQIGIGPYKGCETALIEIRNELRLIASKTDASRNPRGLRYFVYSHLCNLGLIEYGTSINYCWLTDKGRELLDDLEEMKLV
jgi:hypothetical protein